MVTAVAVMAVAAAVGVVAAERNYPAIGRLAFGMCC